MDVLLFGSSGRIGKRITNELLDRGHSVTGVTRGETIEKIDDSDFEVATGDATNVDDVVRLVSGHDVVASALGPDRDNVDELTTMATALLEGIKQSDVDRFVWTSGAAGLYIDESTQYIDTEEMPERTKPIGQAHIDAYAIIRKADDIKWSVITPPASIQPGERTGKYRTAEDELVGEAIEESRISMEDFAIAFVDELETGDAIHTRIGVGY